MILYYSFNSANDPIHEMLSGCKTAEDCCMSSIYRMWSTSLFLSLYFLGAAVLLPDSTLGFSSNTWLASVPSTRRQYRSAKTLTSLLSVNDLANSDKTTKLAYQSIFNFTDKEENAVSKFERIDDAIMGGISLSSIKQLPEEDFARWSGVCRTDGGGFCGTRTMPFQEPIRVGSAEGFYLLCRFTSDDEPERRVWKVTTRSEDSRGEQLYQAMFQISKSNQEAENGGWQRVLVPFDSFVQVRGPRLVDGAPKLNVTAGLYQVGVALSKFQIASTTKELEDFRAGYFELQLKEIGVYTSSPSDTALLGSETVQTLTKEEAEKRKPVLLKILFPVSKLLFSEKLRRRKSADKILRERGYSRWQIAKYSFTNRVVRRGLLRAILQTCGMFFQDSVRLVLGWSLRLVLFYPLVFILRIFKLVTSPFKKKTMTEK